MRRASISVTAALLLAASIGMAAARADGLPVLGVDVGGAGVATPSRDARYVTLPAGSNTLVARVNPIGGSVLASRLVRGTFTIPAVAYDGSASGLSADGRTLVLIQPRVRFPRAQTPLMVIDTRALHPRQVIRLHGDFSFDAISPRGSLLYLIQYTTPNDPTKYLVRAYDLHAGHLLARPVSDPHESGAKMRGAPVTRTTSLNGRWAYTLYDGAGGTPFVHALDTSSRSAHCIDLRMLAGTYLSNLRLRLNRGEDTLTVADGRRAFAVVDTGTFAARVPMPRAAPRPKAGDGITIPWALLSVSGAAALAAIGGVLLLLRRRSGCAWTG